MRTVRTASVITVAGRRYPQMSAAATGDTTSRMGAMTPLSSGIRRRPTTSRAISMAIDSAM
jgi:hypothetical protein